MCQRLIDHCLDFRVGQFGVFVSKLAFKNWTSGGNIAFLRLSQPLASLIIPCPALFGPFTSYVVGSSSGSGIRIHPLFEAGFRTSSKQTEDENQSESHDAAPWEIYTHCFGLTIQCSQLKHSSATGPQVPAPHHAPTTFPRCIGRRGASGILTLTSDTMVGNA